MVWKRREIEEQKETFIKTVLERNTSLKRACVEFGISRETGYKLLRRYRDEGMGCLKSRSRKPRYSPRQTEPRIIEKVLRVRASHPKWSGKKIRCYLTEQGYVEMPSAKTIQRILKAHGCINPEESAKHKPFIRFEHDAPNRLWQMDFKGWFNTGSRRCYPLTVLDDHSRFCLGLRSCENQQKTTVKEVLVDIFRCYGLPERMTMDNGSPWGYASDQRYTEFTLWLMRLGVKVSHSRPYHPQTQGKIERFHRTLNEELISLYSFRDLHEAQWGFDGWRKMYNEERPHEAIGFKVPKHRYVRSERSYPEVLPRIEYDSGFEVRKVNKGILSYDGRKYRVGKGLSGYPVGVKVSEECKDKREVYFMENKVLIIDLTNTLE